MIRRRAIGRFAAWLGALTVVPFAVQADERLQTLLYDADQIYSLHATVGFVVDLQFEGSERYVGSSGGDLDALAIAAFENHVFIKPRQPDVDTNLTLFTTRRLYRFHYHVETARVPTVYAIRFAYAAEPVPVAESPPAPPARPHNTDYWYCGARSLAPSEAWDDGRDTHLRFAREAPLPAIFLLDESGRESLLNGHADGEEWIVHRIAHRFVLRRGRLTACLLNRGARDHE